MAKVLIADDEPNMRELVRVTLETGRFEIVEAEDGDQALSLAQRECPDLVFLDWTMPGLAGIEVCARLRADPATADAKIVMLTARAQAVDRSAALEAGVDDYITKPFSPVKLLEKVREVLGPEALL
jgi:two-component system phosphate regulon response regulator PhoB